MRTDRVTSFALVAVASVMLKTEFAFLADCAIALPLSEATTAHSPTSLVNPLAILPVASSSKVQVCVASSPANGGPNRRRNAASVHERLIAVPLGEGR